MIEGIQGEQLFEKVMLVQRFVVIKFTMYTAEFYDVEAETANVAIYKAKKLEFPFEKLYNNVNAYGEGMIALQYDTPTAKEYIISMFKQWFFTDEKTGVM